MLLDISNNDEYIWTTSFEPSSSSTKIPNTQPGASAKTSALPSSLSQSNNTGVNAGSIIGSLIGGILLTIGSSFLYKRYKNKKEQNIAIPTPGEERNSNPQETSAIHYQSQQTPSQIQQVIIPVPEDAKPSVQVDQDALQNSEVNNLRLSSQHNNNDDNIDNSTTRNFNQGSE